jgi:hypothetical protein
VASLLAAYPVSGFAGLAAARRHQAVTILDVRFARPMLFGHPMSCCRDHQRRRQQSSD